MRAFDALIFTPGNSSGTPRPNPPARSGLRSQHRAVRLFLSLPSERRQRRQSVSQSVSQSYPSPTGSLVGATVSKSGRRNRWSRATCSGRYDRSRGTGRRFSRMDSTNGAVAKKRRARPRRLRRRSATSRNSTRATWCERHENEGRDERPGDPR